MLINLEKTIKNFFLERAFLSTHPNMESTVKFC